MHLGAWTQEPDGPVQILPRLLAAPSPGPSGLTSLLFATGFYYYYYRYHFSLRSPSSPAPMEKGPWTDVCGKVARQGPSWAVGVLQLSGDPQGPSGNPARYAQFFSAQKMPGIQRFVKSLNF